MKNFRFGQLAVVLVIMTHAIGCSTETNKSLAKKSPSAVEAMELADNEALLIYERGVSGELPKKASLRDSSRWDLTKVTMPWEVTRVTSSAFSLEAPTELLGIPNNGLDHDYQRIVSLSYFYNPKYKLSRVPSPARIRELLEANYAFENPEYSTPPFTAYQTGRGPMSDDDDIYLYDADQNIMCEVTRTGVPNPAILCSQTINGRVMRVRMPRAALRGLAERISAFNKLVQDLACIKEK